MYIVFVIVRISFQFRGFQVTTMACQGNLMRFDLTTEDISKEADELIQKCKAVYDTVGSLASDDVSYDNVVKVSLPFSVKVYQVYSSVQTF